MARKFNTAYAADVFKGLLNRLTWNKVLEDVDTRLSDLEDLKPSVENAIENVTQVGVTRINEVLTPAILSIQQLTSMGFLIAHSSTPFLLEPTSIYTFIVPPGAERDLFTPSPYCTISRTANYTDYAFVRTLTYIKETGQYRCQVVTTSSNFGIQNDWVISAGTGVTQAIQGVLGNTETARNGAVAAANAANIAAAAIAADRAAIANDKATVAADKAAAAISAKLAATFDPTTYQRTTLTNSRFSFADLNLNTGQTVFVIPGGYTPGTARVFLNGGKLVAGEFTATNGTTVVLGEGVHLGDVLEIETFYVNGILDVAPLHHTHSIADFNLTGALTTKTWILTSDQAEFEMLDIFQHIDFWVQGSMVVEGIDFVVSGKKATFSPPIPAGTTVTARAVALPLSIPQSYTKAEMDVRLNVRLSDDLANLEFYGRFYGGA